jgi:peptidoglycan/xylan/chitin deacetylase (PgdA/CDA1 family)
MYGDDFKRRRRRWSRRGSAWPLLLAVVLAVFVTAAAAALAWTRLDSGGPDGGSPAAAVSSSPPASPSPAAPTPSAAPAPRPRFVKHPQPVPILLYHHVLTKPRGPRLVVMSTARFRRQLAYLAAHGYEAVTLRRVYDAWTGKGTLPPHPVVISFDDGYVDQVRNAAPLLRKYGWPAQLNLVFEALYLGSTPPADRLTPAMVRSLLDDGWELASHSLTHPDLTRLPGRQLRRQIVVSRRRLRETFRVPVDFFCYPGGIYTKSLKTAVRSAGYLAATGTRYGAATPRDLYSLPRIYCYKGETNAVFAARLRDTLAVAY